MEGSPILVVVLVAILLGLTIGKAWERYKLRDGRWVDRRKLRESPHYLLGLNFVVAGHIDQAIEELNKAAGHEPDALEVQMILGDLYREKGQVGRAIQVHQQVLQHRRMRRQEQIYALLSLGLDFKRGGFVDRAVGAFNEVLRLDATNEYALLNLEKLYEEQHQWGEAYEVRQKLMEAGGAAAADRNRAILAFLENELGLEALRRMQYDEAAKHFEAAIDLDTRAVPAYLNLGDVRFYRGDAPGAAAMWERVIQVSPERAYLAFERLESVYPKTPTPDKFADVCRAIIAASPQDWRARLALARHLAAAGNHAAAIDLLFEALINNPHGLSIHQTIWQTLTRLDLAEHLVSRYVELTRDAVFYLDPHICVRCRYRSTELLWQCPQCHEWNSFVEERIAPAKEENV